MNMTTHESNRIEFKRELSDSLEKEVVAFLNYREVVILLLLKQNQNLTII
ncbi:MAG: hypothetical protein HQK77_01075 [Desulfobacterales bacterium]|nr:hypothetical protein [Desulfobacterales bacterium]